MKKIATFIIIVLGTLASQAQNINFTLLSSNQNEAVVRIDFGTYHTETVTVDGTEMQTLHSADAYPVLKKGSPELLQTAFSLIVPEGSQPETEILSEQFTEVTHFALAPSKGKLYRNVNPENIPYTKNTDYQSANYLMGSAVAVGEEYQLRDFHGVSVKVFPFDYNPSAQKLKVYSSVTVKVRFNSSRSISAPAKNNLTFDALYADHFLNYTAFRGTPVTEEGDILIIAPQEFMEAMQPYVDWKIRTGYNTEIVPLSTAGSTSGMIKNYITSYYNEHNLAFVVIVGDNAQFPTPTVGGNKSDNNFTELVGNDSYPDIILGKISAENVSQVETQVQRFIEYEQNPPETSHFPSFMGIASDQGPGDNNEYDYQHIRNINNKLLNYTYTSGYELFEGSQGGLDASGNPTASMVATGVNAGVGIITYCGHGDVQMWVSSGFNNGNVNSLTNVGKLPFIYSVACVNGEYHTGTCFAEAWLRATYEGQPTGAVGFTGSTINQPWNSPMCAQDAMIDWLVGTNPANQKYTYGGIFFNGMIHMLDVYSDVSVFRTWILFGDPTLHVRTAVPAQLELSYNEILPVGVPSVTFSSPVENARIAVTNGTEIIAVGNIQNGEYTMTFSQSYLPTDTLRVLATAPNYLPYEGIITFIPNEGPYVIVGNLTMTDDYVPFVNNRQNDLPEFGKRMKVKPEIVNIGNETASNFRINISTEDPYITINTNEITVSSLAADDTLLSDDASFLFTIENVVPANHNAIIKMEIICGNDTIVQNKSVKLYAPSLTITSLTIDDTQSGNGNHRVDYGETFNCVVTIANTGNMPVTSGTFFLESFNDELTLSTSSIPFQTIESNGTTNVIFTATANNSIHEPTISYIKSAIWVNYFFAEKNFPVKIGEVTEDWETGGFTNMSWINNSSSPWTIVTSNPYEGTYCAKSGAITHSSTSILRIVDTVSVTDSISFYYKVSSEEDYDKLLFKMDGQTKGEWSGIIGWTHAAFPVTPGVHTYQWTYSKDHYGSAGHDCAYLDNISFPCGKVNHPVSIHQYTQNESSLQVWPNPATNYIHVAIDNDGQDYTFRIFDLNGRLLQGGRLTDNDTQISVSHYTSGTYILQVEDNQHHIQTKKIVKK
ncbi:MAG: T9SS type A sorting domain-containing protein [Bacteroidales bacterium]|nr:T9SS type A sorting domain-containing protein [Bacteroidales bacterium]